jgi:hypothetical protein
MSILLLLRPLPWLSLPRVLRPPLSHRKPQLLLPLHPAESLVVGNKGHELKLV